MNSLSAILFLLVIIANYLHGIENEANYGSVYLAHEFWNSAVTLVKMLMGVMSLTFEYYLLLNLEVGLFMVFLGQRLHAGGFGDFKFILRFYLEQ